jgi:hypothetical protein
MTWGGISFRHHTPLIIIDDTLTAQRYIGEVLRSSPASFVAAYRDATHFQHSLSSSNNSLLTSTRNQNASMANTFTRSESK